MNNPPTHTIDVPFGEAQALAGWAYGILGNVLGVLAFVAVWIGAGFSWGFLLGLTLGWVPAIIAAVLMRYLWPLGLALAFVAYWFLWR